jgi:hypothetical protein
LAQLTFCIRHDCPKQVVPLLRWGCGSGDAGLVLALRLYGAR